MTERITINSCFIFTSGLFLALCLMVFLIQGAYASDDLWAVLKKGGKVVLMRHAQVEPGSESANSLIRDPSCKTERNLSSKGKRDARELGNRFTQHYISVSRVLHSPFCRTTETAQLAFGRAGPANYLSLLEILESSEAASQTEVLSKVIGSYTGDGNLVLVTHEPNISALSFELIKHLDFLVIQPKGNSEFEELGVIRFLEE